MTNVTSTYTDFAPTNEFLTIAMAPSGRTIAWTDRAGSNINIFLHDIATDTTKQLTFFTDRSARVLAWHPSEEWLAAACDENGDEEWRLHRVDVTDGTVTALLPHEYRRVEISGGCVSPDGSLLAFSAPHADPERCDPFILELATGEVRSLQHEADSTELLGWSEDSQLVRGATWRSNTDHTPHAWEVASGQRWTYLAFPPGDLTIPMSIRPDGTLVCATTLDHEHMTVGFARPTDDTITWAFEPDWEVLWYASTSCAQTLAVTVNENGVSKLALLQADTDNAPWQPTWLADLPTGAISAASGAWSGGLSILMSTPTSPPNVYLVDIASATLRQVTDNQPVNAPQESLISCTATFFPARDDHQIGALVYRPSGPGPFSVVVHIHGGPEWQSFPSYSPLTQALLARGIGVVAPNVRGSTGYGKTFQRLIYRDWGGGDLQDFASVNAALRELDWIDPDRIGVYGGSYGGFATLSCLARQPDLWACGVDIVGPANLVTFVNSVPAEWRPMMAGWIGDPVADIDLLTERSPVTYAENIVAPLFIIQGANDPRVAKAESDQMVASLQAHGTQVRYDVYPDEGHGFTRKTNADNAYSDVVEFLAAHLTATT